MLTYDYYENKKRYLDYSLILLTYFLGDRAAVQCIEIFTLCTKYRELTIEKDTEEYKTMLYLLWNCCGMQVWWEVVLVKKQQSQLNVS